MLSLLIALLACAPTNAHRAADLPTEIPVRSAAATTGLFLAGGVAGFVAHEAGHVAMNLLLGNKPEIVPLWGFGFVPFFAISPNISCGQTRCTRANGMPFAAGRRGKYAIVTAGFEVQHLSSEVMLTLMPYMRFQRAPLLKGWLTFNIALSVAYALTSVIGIEDSHGDAGGAANLSGMSKALMGTLLVAPAAVDAVRYLFPNTPWAPWVSRGLKAGFIGMAWSF